MRETWGVREKEKNKDKGSPDPEVDLYTRLNRVLHFLSLPNKAPLQIPQETSYCTTTYPESLPYHHLRSNNSGAY